MLLAMHEANVEDFDNDAIQEKVELPELLIYLIVTF